MDAEDCEYPPAKTCLSHSGAHANTHTHARTHSLTHTCDTSDDDSYVRVEKFVSDVKSWSMGGGQSMIIHAADWSTGSPMKGGKWKELRWKSRYPKFPSGAGHVVNRNVAAWVVAHGDSLIEYQGEDTSIGIWLDQAEFTAF